MEIKPASYFINLSDWKLSGSEVKTFSKKLKDLSKIFKDKCALETMDPEQIVYQVQAIMPVDEGSEGGLFFGNTTIFPGKVGNEYFMTRGHYHANDARAEYYWGIKGEGVLLMMDRNRKIQASIMKPGSLHFIPLNVAHRVANTGIEPLIFGACWPSDAGHEYNIIDEKGFSSRIIEDGSRAILSS